MQDGVQNQELRADNQKPVYLGMFAARRSHVDLSLIDILAIALSVVWIVGLGAFFLIAPSDVAGGMTRLNMGVTILTIFMPVALLAIALYSSRAVRQIREESERLQLAINAMRQSMVAQRQSGVLEMTPVFEKKLDEIAAAQRNTDAKLARFTSIRPELEREAAQARKALGPQTGSAATAPASLEMAQPSLGLATPGETLGPPLSIADFITALNFPNDPDDKDGFAALRRAMRDRVAARLIRAAQDVLTLLSQDGIYMDDLTPDSARPEIWRRFAKGERGKTVAILGGIRDRSSLALSARRMRQETIFRDSVHHFLRRFDQTLTEFEKSASDLDIISLTDTRSARAFMLLGRVTGTFG